MKVQVDGKDLFELSENQKKVIQNDIPTEIFEEDMKRRLHWVLNHKFERCLERLKKEWEPKLASRMDSLPTNAEALCELIFSQPDYKSRSERNNPEG